jgi:hypothetical protein
MTGYSMSKYRDCQSWTRAEDELIRLHYPAGIAVAQSHLPGRTILAIKNRAHKLRVLMTRRMSSPELQKSVAGWTRWSDVEDTIIVRDYPLGGAILCARSLEHRTIAAIVNRAHTLDVIGPRNINPDAEPTPERSMEQLLETFRRMDVKANEAISERSRAWNAVMKARAALMNDRNHQRRVS